MKNANRNLILAAAAVVTFAVAPSALADVRVHVSLPLPPPPREVIGRLPVPPPPVADFRYARRDDGRWNYENRNRDDRWRGDGHYRDRDRWAFVEGRWVRRPFPGAVWVDGHYDLHGRYIPGYWARARYR